MASVTIKSFFFKKPSVLETESARGIEAAEVLP
jgi:hypothetical protein